MPPRGFAWTPEIVAQAVRLWNDNELSAVQIVAQLGLPSKGSLIGKMNRHPLAMAKATAPPRKPKAPTLAAKPPQTLERVAKKAVLSKTTSPAPVATIEVHDVPRPSYGPTPFIEARPNQCRFPLWSDHERTGDVCGCKAITGLSWCPDHFDRVSDPRRRNLYDSRRATARAHR